MHFGLFCMKYVHKNTDNRNEGICVIFSSFGISILIIMLPTSYHAKREIEKRVNYYLSIFKFKRQIHFALKYIFLYYIFQISRLDKLLSERFRKFIKTLLSNL